MDEAANIMALVESVRQTRDAATATGEMRQAAHAAFTAAQDASRAAWDDYTRAQHELMKAVTGEDRSFILGISPAPERKD